MMHGFQATNPIHRKLDILDSVDRLRLDLFAETDEERKMLANLRRLLSRALAEDRKVVDVAVTIDGLLRIE